MPLENKRIQFASNTNRTKGFVRGHLYQENEAHSWCRKPGAQFTKRQRSFDIIVSEVQVGESVLQVLYQQHLRFC